MQLGRYRKLLASIGGTVAKIGAMAAAISAAITTATPEQLTAIMAVEDAINWPGGIQGAATSLLGILGVLEAIAVWWAKNDP